jgi:hypothetical protein
MNDKQKAILNEYAELKLQAKELEYKMKGLNAEVLNIMSENSIDEIEIGEYGKLTMGARRTWIYPESITQREEDLKEEKKEMQQTGEADYIEKHYVTFRQDNE